MAASGGGADGAVLPIDDRVGSSTGAAANPTIMVLFQGPLVVRTTAEERALTPLPELNIAGELESVEEAIEGTKVRLDAIGGPWEGLSAMRQPGVRVVEIGCHGEADGDHLVVEDAQGFGQRVEANVLRKLFDDNPGTSLVVLSACYSARIATEAFRGASFNVIESS